MNKHFIQVTNGLVPVAVLLLLVVALVAGQARANLPHHVTAVPTLSAQTSVILNAEMLRKIESLPQIVDTLLALPADIELTISSFTVPSTKDADSRQRPSAQ